MTDAEDRAKLEHLIEHWVEHNESHERSYAEWAERADAMGEPGVAALIREAVERMRDADGLLIRAQHELEG